MSQPNNAVNSVSADTALNAFIFDYLKKNNMTKAANAFRTETQLPPDSEPPINVPDSFLHEWWVVFWDLFLVGVQATGSPTAKAYLENQKQQTQASIQLRHAQIQRQLQSQRNFTMANANGLMGVRPGNPAVPSTPQLNASKSNTAATALGNASAGRATPTPVSGPGMRPGVAASPAIPNGSMSMGDEVNHQLSAQQYMMAQQGMLPGQMRQMMGLNTSNGSVTQNMAEIGLANRDAISLNPQEKSKLIDRMKTNSGGQPSNPGHATNAKKGSQGDGSKGQGKGSSADTDANEQDAKRRRSNTSGQFSPAIGATVASSAGPDGQMPLASQALLNSSNPIMTVSTAASNPQLQQQINQTFHMLNPQRQMMGQRPLSGAMATSAAALQMQPFFAGAVNGAVLGNLTSQEMNLHAQQQRVQQLKNPGQFAQFQHNPNFLMPNGQMMLASSGAGQPMIPTSSQPTMSGVQMTFSSQPTVAAFNSIAQTMPNPQMVANPTPSPATPGTGPSKKRKATPQLSAKNKNNHSTGDVSTPSSGAKASPLSAASVPSSGTLAPNTLSMVSHVGSDGLSAANPVTLGLMPTAGGTSQPTDAAGKRSSDDVSGANQVSNAADPNDPSKLDNALLSGIDFNNIDFASLGDINQDSMVDFSNQLMSFPENPSFDFSLPDSEFQPFLNS
ncbi:hypothetical protein H4R34_002208 [Dimargaris verticillata]|uniref:LisH domain-containing protein n=1 Tax=Dimargaris verticillata TaxID=2761393 RepID=A0A9W8B9X2_9FUNG|nr:hypothetical protein H4R34_002208 [Dimargaris verticillata]